MERKKQILPDGKCQSINKDGEPCWVLMPFRGKTTAPSISRPAVRPTWGEKGETEEPNREDARIRE